MTPMRLVVPVALVLLAGCMSGPRPYDGVIGYRVQATPDGVAVSYVDEADVKPEKVLRRIRGVCATRLKEDPAAVTVVVTGSTQFQQDVPMNVAIPVAMQGNGSTGGSGPAAAQAKSVVSQHQGVMRLMELRRTEASCRRTGGS